MASSSKKSQLDYVFNLQVQGDLFSKSIADEKAKVKALDV